MARERIVSGAADAAEEDQVNWSLRPRCLAEYIGQPSLVEKLRIAIAAAKMRREPMEHVLLHGPPGLGKTTLAHIIAGEMTTKLHLTSGPALTRAGDLVGVLTKLAPGDVLFIDEIHRLPAAVEEFIYPAMEDFRIDVNVDSGMHARSITIRLKPFTLIGATTRTGLISGPLRSRFGMAHHLTFYSEHDLLTIVRRSAGLLGVGCPEGDAAFLGLARRSRGTPRIANRLLRRVRDYAQVHGSAKGRTSARLPRGSVDAALINDALTLEGVDTLGLDELDRTYLKVIGTTYQGGPVGLEAIAATMGDDAQTLEDVVEPFLLQIGFLARTRRGRQLTPDGAKYIGATPPRSAPDNEPSPDVQTRLFGQPPAAAPTRPADSVAAPTNLRSAFRK